ncbi:FAD-binding oxidoreductase [Cryptosporangium aurantiacum]|uniref:FAD/FMN-containing dehydrogenase n=1 Tax=Cryptosporangium aurantiacum TaxID=134849 RepID=A0A1M7RN17_9ACTN|nr:FAD-binding oxidoreductase [Cryptosporangium aurantiacum]SHN47601.1 FAD/FMN-containing dehydrogenase [Cryptosporangium aurantiacum]
MPVTRRRFLTLGAIAATAACTDSSPVRPSPSPTRRPEGLDLPGLRRVLDGPLLLPGDAGYPTAAQPFNVALGTRRPAAIARVASTADVRTCVLRAGGRGVPLAARSGGHSYPGYSTPDGGVVVDLGTLNTVTVKDDGTAIVGAGARLIDVYAALAARGRALPAGSCPTVGIGGSTLGGGLGVLARSYGLTCDHLRAATIVTADGDMRRVDASHDAELFWSLRGGGGGHSGIVTEFTFDTVPAPTVTNFTLRFPATASARVLSAWSDWMQTAPDRTTSICGITAAATPTNRVTGTWTGPVAGLSAHLSALISAVGTAPTSRTMATHGYLDAMRAFAGCLDKSIEACHPDTMPGGTLRRDAFRASSRVADRPVDATTADAVVDLLRRQTGMVLLFDSLGGAVGTLAPGDTAFVHRRAHATVQVYSGRANSVTAVTEVQQALRPLVGTGAYVNYLDAGQSDWATAYYGANLPRLRRTVRRYDPDGVFTFPQSVLRT